MYNCEGTPPGPAGRKGLKWLGVRIGVPDPMIAGALMVLKDAIGAMMGAT